MTARRDPFVVAADCDEHGVLHLDMPRPQYQAIARARFGGQRVDIEIRLRKSKRSLEQNKAVHASWKGWADHLGYAVDELKREMLGIVFGTREVTSPLTGETRTVLNEPHTSALNVSQCCELMERAVIEAAGTGYHLELPDEWKARMAKERAQKAA